MQVQTSASAVSRSSSGVRSAADRPSAVLAQDVWTRRFAVRLHELRPQSEPGFAARIANDMWLCVAHFNPEIAAEMEHESGCWEH